MSDERQIDAGMRHAEARAVLPWSMAAPDEWLMMAEEMGEVSAEEAREELFKKLVVFLFADGQPECWECVAMRGLALIRHCAPSLLQGRELGEVAGVRERSGGKVQQGFTLTEFVQGCAGSAWADWLRGMLGFLFPDGPAWLENGCKGAYLIARSYQPELVMITKEVSERVPERDAKGRKKLVLRHFPKRVEMNYEDMARVFGESTEKARQRWSARAQNRIRRPIEEAGGTMHFQFGKSATTRARYAERAMGNQHRRSREMADGGWQMGDGKAKEPKN